MALVAVLPSVVVGLPGLRNSDSRPQSPLQRSPINQDRIVGLSLFLGKVGKASVA